MQHKDRKRANDLMLMLGLNETIDQLAMAVSIGEVMLMRERSVTS